MIPKIDDANKYLRISIVINVNYKHNNNNTENSLSENQIQR